jgi:amino acid adenylation domain-containing protein
MPMCVHKLFEERAAESPHSVAIVWDEGEMTYAELNARANQLAHHLVERGVRLGALVGLCVERSVETIVGLLGILKAGGAYVPLDASYPRERLAFMLEDTGASVLVTQRHLATALPAHRSTVVCLDADREIVDRQSTQNPINAAMAESLAYVMYTSGSTGRPKGVCVPHRAVARLVCDTNYVDLGPDETLLQFAPVSFDASTFEIWGALLNGARLVVPPARTLSLVELGEIIARHRVTTLWLTAGLFHQMVESHLDGLRPLRQLLAGGDVLSPTHVRRALDELKDCTLINGYGPTENTTFTCCHSMTTASTIGASVPIGRPVANTQVYLLGHDLCPVGVGEPGELYAGGDGVACGYLNRPELTAERFVLDPFSAEPGARMYRTGDTARYLEDGTVEFLGRIDAQIKIRGFRVEPGEVESALARHPAVGDNAVVTRAYTAGDKRLVAYVVPRDAPPPTSTELRRFLRASLPEYMIPSAFVLLEALPLTPNGKVDRHALPAEDRGRPALETAFAEPQTETESLVAGALREVLDLEAVGLDDNFFDLGAHSLHITQVHGKLQLLLKTPLALVAMFEHPTVRSLARHLTEERRELPAFPKVQDRARQQREAIARRKRAAGGKLNA